MEHALRETHSGVAQKPPSKYSSEKMCLREARARGRVLANRAVAKENEDVKIGIPGYKMKGKQLVTQY